MNMPPTPVSLLGGPLLAMANRTVASLVAGDTVFDAARLMATQRLSCVPVLDAEGRALGVVTEARLLAAAYGDQGPSRPIATVMQPALCVPQDIDAASAFQQCLAASGAPLLLVDAHQHVVAMVGEGDFRSQLQLALIAGHHRVATLMARVLRLLSPQHTLAQAIELMRSSAGTAVVITVDDRPLGVLTSRDVARLMADKVDADRVTLAEVMSHPVVSLPVEATIHEAADRMLAARTRHLVVVDATQRVVGVLDEHELTRAMAVQVMDAGIEHERVRQRAVLDAIPDLVWLKDPEGVYVTCNPRFERLYGATEAQIRGRTDYDFVPRDLADLFRLQDRRAMDLGGPSINEEELTFADDGHRELLQTVKTPVRDRTGRLLGVLGVGRDITALRRAEDEYRWLFARNPAPMFLYERGSLAVLRVNEAFCALYGYTEDEARRLHLTDLYLPEDQPAVRDRVATMRGLVNVGEWRHRRRDGSIVHIVAQSHDTQHDGKACRVAVVTDVTGLKRSQQRDRQRLALMERLVRGDPLASLLEQLARDHETLFEGSLCSVLLLDADGTHLRHGAAPSLPDFYCTAIDGLAVGIGVGCCGEAVHSGRRVVAEQLDVHPNWEPFRELAQLAGLQACWSEPIIGSGGTVLGTFAVYRRHPGGPAPEELDHMQFAVQLAATAITHGSTTRALRSSERRLRDILHAIPDMVWLKDQDGVYRSCNAAFARMAGLPVEQIVGRRDDDITTADRAELFRQQDRQVLGSGQPLNLERWMTIRATGEHVLTELIKSPLFDDEGRAVGMLGVARDITLIKQGAQAVAEQQRLIDTMLDQTTDAIVLVDPATLQFVTFNDAACQGLGYTREAFARLTPAELQAEQGLPEIRDNIRRVMDGALVRFDTTHRRADGGIQAAALTLRRVTYGGRVLLSSVWRDVTEERRHEARIQRLNRSYAVLSSVNEAVVRLRDRDALFTEVCRITTQAGAFGLAWIGLVDEASGRISPQAHAVRSEGYVESLHLTIGAPDAQVHSSLVAKALHHRRACVIQDVAVSTELPRMQGRLLERGHRSLAAFPILPAGGQRLVLVVYSDTVGHFDDEQVALFDRLVQDVGFALEFIAADQARAEAQRFREQLIESVAGLFFALDASGHLVLWNRQLEVVSGHPHEVLATMRAADFFEPSEQALVCGRLEEAFGQGQAQVEANLTSRDGTRTPFLFVVRRLDMAHGPLVVGTGVDISDRVRSEHELTRYRDQLEDLVHQRTAELEAVNERLHREDRRLRAMLALSQRASALDERQLFRLGLDEILRLTDSTAGCVRSVRNGDPVLQLQAWAGTLEPPPEDLAQRVLASGEACIVDGETAAELCLCNLGLHRLVGVPVHEGGRVVMVVCAANKAVPYDDADARELQLLATDLWAIVQRRRIEIALGEAKVAADAANLAKSAFLANMSHEIRTPMNAVIGFAHLLRRDPLTQRQQDHLGKITDAGQHLLQVINDILDFSKIEAHKVTLEHTDFPLHESLGRVQAMQLDAARAKQLPLQLVIDGACPPALRGDRLRLEQILLNLLSNAVKFTAHGRIDLRVSLLPATAVAAGDPVWLRFEVTDTGIGMTQDQLAHVFEAFAQADASTTRRFGGTGLGLAISKRLVQLMNGRMGAHSQPDVGSTFWVELPLQRAQLALAPPVVADEAAPDPAELPLDGVQVLVAEDNPINQEVTATLLSALGMVVQVVDSGEAALQAFDPRRHELILMDVQMPGMDGLRATAALRARADGQRVPIVAMTANAFAEDRAQCLAAGMNDYLSKPVEPQALERCLMRWLRPVLPAVAPPASVAHQAADDALRRRLQALGDLDLGAPLARMRGAWPLYLRTLRMFIDHHHDDSERLGAIAEAGNAQALRALAHSLAGAAATVGAVEVMQQAQALQRLLDGGASPSADAVLPLAAALRRCVQQVQAALAAAPAAAPVSPGAAPATRAAPAAVRAVLLQLQPLVAAHDTAALTLFERHRPALEATLGVHATALARHLDHFDFGAAQAAVLQALRASDAAPA
jgi:PAS domain S-box-containing protein